MFDCPPSRKIFTGLVLSVDADALVRKSDTIKPIKTL
jgi:hypothetical protein